MPYEKDIHHRRSIRLKDYDYSRAGAYFVTIATEGKACLFGSIAADEVQISDAGRMVAALWKDLPNRFPTIEIDAYVVMPNHFHGIVVVGEERAGIKPAPTLGNMIGAFKSITTHQYMQGVRDAWWIAFERRLWQRNYYERVIRNERELNAVREYVTNNPLQWALDRENPQR